MIRNIVFDMGGVLIQWNPGTILDTFGLTAGDKALLLEELFSVEWVMGDRGLLSGEEIAARVRPRVPEHLHSIVDELAPRWFDRFLIPIPHMADLIRELKENGYRICLLSNAPANLREYFPRIPGSEYFDCMLVSGEEKLLKPQHEIYELLYSRFALNPAECVFIDDNPSNAEGAILTGMPSLVFRGNLPKLRRQLRQLGVRCSE